MKIYIIIEEVYNHVDLQKQNQVPGWVFEEYQKAVNFLKNMVKNGNKEGKDNRWKFYENETTAAFYGRTINSFYKIQEGYLFTK